MRNSIVCRVNIFDARWQLPTEKNLKSYARYDASIHKAAKLTDSLSKLPVHLDQQEELLQPGDAPQVALYCGWYSLGKYVDAFEWQRGAVGYHIASSEATTLKKDGSQVWCKRMLEDGVAATIGPVAEPYAGLPGARTIFWISFRRLLHVSGELLFKFALFVMADGVDR